MLQNCWQTANLIVDATTIRYNAVEVPYDR